MKKILLSSVLAGFIFSSAFAQEYIVDKAHSEVSFKIKHLQITNVTGKFKDYEAVVDYDKNNATFNKLQANIKIISVDTDNQTRDNHLQQADFFDSKKFPEMIFVMKKYKKEDNENGKMIGDLTIAGVTKEITLDVEIGGVAKGKDGKERLGFSLNGKIKRSEFNLAPKSSTIALGDDVKISVEVEAIVK